MIKKILLFTYLIALATMASAQQNGTTTSSDRIIAKKKLYVQDYFINKFQRDTTFDDSLKIPTSLAVRNFVAGRVGALTIVRTVLSDSSWRECLNGVCDTIIIHHVSSGGGGTTYTAGHGLVLQGTEFKIKDTSNGAATKLMWLFDKKAFRAGSTTSTQWDISNIGTNSTAFGLNTIASGTNSFSAGNGNTSSSTSTVTLGDGNTASGGYGVAIGKDNISNGGGYSISIGQSLLSSGIASVALGGNNTRAIGNYSIAMGSGTRADDDYAFSSGYGSWATATFAQAHGYICRATGISSHAMGDSVYSSGTYSNGMGHYLYSKSYAGSVFGAYNDSTNANNSTAYSLTNRAFEIGNGTSNTSRSNAMTVLFNGNVGIGTTTPTEKLDIVGRGKIFDSTIISESKNGFSSTINYNDEDNFNTNNFAGYFYATGTGSANQSAAIRAISDNSNVGDASVGVWATGYNIGVYGTSTIGDAISAQTISGIGVSGQSTSGIGVSARSQTNYGMRSISDSGVGFKTSSMELGYKLVTDSIYTVLKTDYVISVFRNSGVPGTVVLPNANGCDGRVYIIKRSSDATNGTITIKCITGGTDVQNYLTGAFVSTVQLGAWGTFGAYLMYQSNGNYWEVIR